MFEKKAAIIDVSKGLLTVSLVTLAAIAGAASNPTLAGITTASVVTLGVIDPLLTKLKGKKEALLEIPQPRWQVRYDDNSWQTVCTTIQNDLPAIIDTTVATLQSKPRTIPTTAVVRQAFIDAITLKIPAWEVSLQNRNLVAIAIADPLLKKVSEVLEDVSDPLWKDAIAKEILDISTQFKQLVAEMKAMREASATSTLADTVQTVANTPEEQTIDDLERKWQKDLYDVYICYCQDDKEKVLEIDDKLKARGILPWFEVTTQNPAIALLSQKDEQIKKIKTAAVFIGKHAIAQWQAAEVETFITQSVERQMGVIPVFLEDTPEKPEMSVFLQRYRGVDFRTKTPDPFEQLMWGITGKKPPLRINRSH